MCDKSVGSVKCAVACIVSVLKSISFVFSHEVCCEHVITFVCEIIWRVTCLGGRGGGKEIERRGGCVVEMSQLKIMPIIIIVSCFERLSMHSYTLKPCLHSSLAPFCLTHPLCLPHLG